MALVDFILCEDEWDSDLYDAEILVERSGCTVFLIEDIAELFDRSVHWVHYQRRTNWLPAARYPGVQGKYGEPGRWTKDQMIVCMAEWLRRGQR